MNCSNYGTIKNIFRHMCVVMLSKELNDQVHTSLEFLGLLLESREELTQLHENSSTNDNSSHFFEKEDSIEDEIVSKSPFYHEFMVFFLQIIKNNCSYN